VPTRAADGGPGVEEMIDRLYSLDPDEFTGERNEAAKQLRADGDKAASDQVKALKKPTAVAWAVNQLPRRNAKLVDDLLDAGASLRNAQRAALSGSGKALREATQERRAVVAKLVDEASAVFRDAGRSPAAHVDAIRSTLEAASTDEAVGELVRSGRLTKEADAPAGFGDVSGFEVLTGGRAAKPAASKEDARPAGTARAEESAAAKRVRERLEGRVVKAEDAVMAARERASEARRDAESAAREADRLERELQTAQRRAERAAAASASADRKLDDSRAALAAAQADLAEES